MKKTNNSHRDSLAKRLKRRGVLLSSKGVSTQELERLWEKYKEHEVIVKRGMSTKDTNFAQLKKILDDFTAEYEEYFIGWYRDAWRFLPEIKFFWQRIDPVKVNNDENFLPFEVQIWFLPPSDWYVDSHFRMPPEEIPDYLKELYGEYLR